MRCYRLFRSLAGQHVRLDQNLLALFYVVVDAAERFQQVIERVIDASRVIIGERLQGNGMGHVPMTLIWTLRCRGPSNSQK